MSEACEIVRYRPEHREAVAELQTVLWSPDPLRNLHYLDWKYAQNPWAVEPRIYLALRGATVVGMRGFYESRWEVGSPPHRVAIPLADDLAIRAEERNTGLVTQIMRAALADLADCGFDFVFSLSAGRLTLLGSLTLGWKTAGRYEASLRREADFHWRNQLRQWLARTRLVWRWAGAPMLRSAAERHPFRLLDSARPAGTGVTIAREPKPAAMAELISSLGHDGRLRHVRSPEYLAWRFANPQHEYRFLYSGGEHLDGYLALRSRVGSTVSAPRVCIVDLEGRNARVRRELLVAAVEAGRFRELLAWASTLSPGERPLLGELGFEPADPQLEARGWPCALVGSTRSRPLDEWMLGSRPLLDPASWDLRMLYSMAG